MPACPVDPAHQVRRHPSRSPGKVAEVERVYWILVALVTAIAAHAAFVLMVPGHQFAQVTSEMARGHDDNSFFILPAPFQAQLFPSLPRQSVTGVCVFDVSAADVTFNANLPEGFWVTTIYTGHGKPIYSVNNRQSGSSTFAVSLSLAPSFIDLVLQATDKERPEIDSGWTVSSPEPHGLIVIWYPLPDGAMRPQIEAAMMRSSCSAGPPREAQYAS
jgi:uncharacterized membrane protein